MRNDFRKDEDLGMMKNVKKFGIRLVTAGFVFAAAMLFFGENGNAYIDSSVMTYVIQAVAGVVIAVGAAVGIYWRKAKKKVQDKLGIEETKEMESDEIIVENIKENEK